MTGAGAPSFAPGFADTEAAEGVGFRGVSSAEAAGVCAGVPLDDNEVDEAAPILAARSPSRAGDTSPTLLLPSEVNMGSVAFLETVAGFGPEGSFEPADICPDAGETLFASAGVPFTEGENRDTGVETGAPAGSTPTFKIDEERETSDDRAFGSAAGNGFFDPFAGSGLASEPPSA